MINESLNRFVNATINFRAAVTKNPHSTAKEFENSLKLDKLKIYINDKLINTSQIKIRKSKAKNIVSGYTLPEHYKVNVSGKGFIKKGENILSFYLDSIPKRTSPHIFIYELNVDVD